MGSPSPLISLLCSLLLRPSSGDCSARRLLRDFAVRELNAFLWLSLVAVTALLLARLFKLLRLWRVARRIAGPPCTSFYGHRELVSGGSLADVLADSHAKYGSVLKLWLGPSQLLVSIKDPKLIKEMLFKAADKSPSTAKAFNLAFGRSSLFASSFEEVGKRGEMVRTELSERLFERTNEIPKKVVESIMERINMSMAEGSVNCKMVSQNMAFTVLGTTFFGDSFLSLSKANLYEELLMMIAKDACFWSSYNVTPFWNWEFWNYQRVCAELKYLTQDMLQQRRKNCKLFHSDGVKTTEKHVICGTSFFCDAAMLDKFFVQELNSCFKELEEESYGNVMGMMLHGCLTTSELIDNILMKLVNHPEIQDKIYTEILIAEKDSMTPIEQHIDKMPLLLATIYEAARLLTAEPLLHRCSIHHDLYLEGAVTIPAGAVVVVPVQLVHKSDSNWGSDACEFNPYRFLSSTKKKLDTSPSEKEAELGENSLVLNDPSESEAFLPFGSGLRACVGQKFVIQGVAALLSVLLKHYEIKLQMEARNDQNAKMNDSRFELSPSMEIAFLRRNHI